MGKRNLSLSTIVNLVCVLGLINAYESPQYTVVHSESDFEIRLYRDSVWMTAPAKEISFRQATSYGFHRLFQYIKGANLNNSRVPMTLPVLTSLVPGAGPLDSSTYVVHFYLPTKFQATPPLPLPELNLMPDSWTSCCKAVRQFSCFLKDRNIVKEAEMLATSLSRSPWANSTSSSSYFAYSIAQYYSPSKFIGHGNEIWVDIDGCESTTVAPSAAEHKRGLKGPWPQRFYVIVMGVIVMLRKSILVQLVNMPIIYFWPPWLKS